MLKMKKLNYKPRSNFIFNTGAKLPLGLLAGVGVGVGVSVSVHSHARVRAPIMNLIRYFSTEHKHNNKVVKKSLNINYKTLTSDLFEYYFMKSNTVNMFHLNLDEKVYDYDIKRLLKQEIESILKPEPKLESSNSLSDEQVIDKNKNHYGYSIKKTDMDYNSVLVLISHDLRSYITTTLCEKGLAKAFNLKPAQVQYLIKQYTATLTDLNQKDEFIIGIRETVLIEILLEYNANCYYDETTDTYYYLTNEGALKISNFLNKAVLDNLQKKTNKRYTPTNFENKKLLDNSIEVLETFCRSTLPKMKKESMLKTSTALIIDFLDFLHIKKNKKDFFSYMLMDLVQNKSNISTEESNNVCIEQDGKKYLSLDQDALSITQKIGKHFLLEYSLYYTNKSIKNKSLININEALILIINNIIKKLKLNQGLRISYNAHFKFILRSIKKNTHSLLYNNEGINKAEYLNFRNLTKLIHDDLMQTKKKTKDKQEESDTIRSVTSIQLFKAISIINYVKDKDKILIILEKAYPMVFEIIIKYVNSVYSRIAGSVGELVYSEFFIKNGILIMKPLYKHGSKHAMENVHILFEYYNSIKLKQLFPTFGQIKPNARLEDKKTKTSKYYIRNIRGKTETLIHYSGKSQHTYISPSLTKQLNKPNILRLNLANVIMYVNSILHLRKYQEFENKDDLINQIDMRALLFAIPVETNLFTIMNNVSIDELNSILFYIFHYNIIDYTKTNYKFTYKAVLNSIKEENKSILSSIYMSLQFELWYSQSFIDDSGRQYSIESPLTNYKSNKIRFLLDYIGYNSIIITNLDRRYVHIALDKINESISYQENKTEIEKKTKKSIEKKKLKEMSKKLKKEKKKKI